MSYVTWEEFQKAFKSKFYPRSFLRYKKEEIYEFGSKRHVHHKIWEEIYQIAKYVIAIVIDDADKCKWF